MESTIDDSLSNKNQQTHATQALASVRNEKRPTPDEPDADEVRRDEKIDCGFIDPDFDVALDYLMNESTDRESQSRGSHGTNEEDLKSSSPIDDTGV